jgi:hypothetical protein
MTRAVVLAIGILLGIAACRQHADNPTAEAQPKRDAAHNTGNDGDLHHVAESTHGLNGAAPAFE